MSISVRGLMIRQIRSARIVMLVTCVYYEVIAWHSAPFESGTASFSNLNGKDRSQIGA